MLNASHHLMAPAADDELLKPRRAQTLREHQEEPAQGPLRRPEERWHEALKAVPRPKRAPNQHGARLCQVIQEAVAIEWWTSHVVGLFLNRYFAMAATVIGVLLYALLWAYVPALKLKSVAVLCLLALGSRFVYVASREDPRAPKNVATMEEKVLSNLKRRADAFAAQCKANVSGLVKGTVHSTFGVVVGLVLGSIELAVSLAFSVALTVLQSAHEALRTCVIQPARFVWGLAAELGHHAFVFGRGVSWDAAHALRKLGATLWRFRGRLLIGLIVCLVAADIVLPYDIIGRGNRAARALVEAHPVRLSISVGIPLALAANMWARQPPRQLGVGRARSA